MNTYTLSRANSIQQELMKLRNKKSTIPETSVVAFVRAMDVCIPIPVTEEEEFAKQYIKNLDDRIEYLSTELESL